jgi:hypothetical protein
MKLQSGRAVVTVRFEPLSETFYVTVRVENETVSFARTSPKPLAERREGRSRDMSPAAWQREADVALRRAMEEGAVVDVVFDAEHDIVWTWLDMPSGDSAPDGASVP